jgi:hypothetical protein
MKKILSIIIILYGTCGVSFADDPELVLNCRMLEGDVKTDIFFERDLNQAFLFKVLKKNKKEIVFKYNNSSEGIYKFNRDTKILTSPGNDGKGNPKIIKSICDGSKAPKRVVIKSNVNDAWEVDGKFIKPECFDYIWVSGDRYETFYDEYFEKLEANHWDNPKFRKFTENIGNYLNKEVPLNHSIDPDWGTESEISLTKQLEGCLSQKPETSVRFNSESGSQNTIKYKVLHTFDRYFAKELAPYIDQKFESVKQVEIVEWGGGSMGPQTHMVVFGVLELEGKKVLLPLRNKSILSEIGKRDSFFEPTGRYSYEAEFDLNDNITEIININDFKQIVSSDGCFKISDFKKDGKIYDFLKKNNIKKYCNQVRPFDDINWLLNQREFKTNIDLIFRDTEHRFQNLIRSQVPDVQVPWSDDPYSLAEELVDSVGYLPEDIQYLNNGKQVVVTGCVYKYCSQKGFIFIDKDNFISLIRHTGYEKVSNEEDFLIFSKTHKSFDEIPKVFVQSVQDWIDELGIDSIVTINTKSKKSWLGVRLKNVTKEIADAEKLKNIEGALVSGVGKASPAEKAGLKAGDIILKFDGSKIDMMSALPEIVSRTEVGKPVELEIWRNKKLVIKKLILGRIRLPETKVRFIGSDNTIKEVKNLFVNSKNSSQSLNLKCVTGDCVNGTGVYYYKDGSVYSGKFKNGKRHGQGTYTFKNGIKSSGEWNNNKTVGSHTITDPNKVGEKIIEKMIKKDGVVLVKVSKTYEDGSKYVGTLNTLNQKKHGKGKLTRSDGFEYEGEFKNDLFHGKGTNTVPNGMKYIGDFKDNEWHGKGTILFLDGGKYVGDLKMGALSGKGYTLKPDGSYHEGGYLNNARHGHGLEKEPSGASYVGNYKNNRWHGYGVATRADGTQYKGTWEKGKLVK